MRSSGVGVVVMGLLNLALIVCIGWAWMRGQERVHQPVQMPVAALELPDLAVLNSLPVPSVEVGTITDQAVFYASRSFYRPPVVSVPITPPDYQMSGTLRLSDSKRIAFVKKAGGQGSTTLHVGDELEGWHVQQIESDRIVLTQGEQSSELRAAQTGGHSSGLIRNPPAPTIVRSGLRVLGGSGPVVAQSAGHAARRDARLYQSAPVGK